MYNYYGRLLEEASTSGRLASFQSLPNPDQADFHEFPCYDGFSTMLERLASRYKNTGPRKMACHFYIFHFSL